MEKKKENRGGARPGAGRKPQASPRKLRDSFFENLNNKDEVTELNKMWQLFKQVATTKAKNGDTEDLQWIFSRIIPVPKEQDIKVEQDITSNGQTLGVKFDFGTQELPDWNEIPKSVKVK
jgi:hypothetical protein